MTERKRIIEGLLLNQQIGFILEATKTCLDIIDSQFNLLFVDEGWQKVYGPFQGRKCYDYFMERKEPCNSCGIPRALETKSSQITEEYLVKEDRFIQVTTIPFQNQNGEWLVAEVNVDITERKRVEEALKDSENKYKTVFENTGAATIIVEDDTTISLANAEFEKLTGYTKDEIEGKKSWTEFVVREDLERLKFQHRLRRENPDIVPKRYEFRFRDRNGQIKDILVTIDLIPGTKKSIASLLDITDRKNIERALMESEERFRLAQHAANIGTFEWNIQSGVNIWTQELEAMYGLQPGSFPQTQSVWENLIYPDDRAEAIARVQQAFETNQPTEAEWRVIWPDGSIHWLWGRWQLSRDGLGKPLLLRGINIDITERKRAEEAAESAAKAKSEFLANMSHEIRTPINAVIGLTGLLLRSNLTQEQRDYVETIRNSGDALLSIINDILDFSKIDSGRMELEAQSFDLINCIEDSLDLVVMRASEKGLNLVYRIDNSNTPRTIIGDPSRLRQILANLLSNAVKFTDEGQVIVSVSGQNLGSNNYEIRFDVRDTGIGIPKDKIDHLFKSFSQIDTSIARKYGGTGLGLVISKRLVELMGGRIWAESEVGKGSIFHFTIIAEMDPSGLKDTRAPVTAPIVDPSMSQYSDLRILLAEDNMVNQKVMLLMLNKLGYKADVVANGLEVLGALERQPYEIVLMDVRMPEMDGLDATRFIRKNWPIEDQPRIIAITASAMEEDKKMCLSAGMDDFISKPVQLEDLAIVLSKCQL